MDETLDELLRMRRGIARSTAALVGCVILTCVAAFVAMMRRPDLAGQVWGLSLVVDVAAVTATVVIVRRVMRRCRELVDEMTGPAAQ